MNIYKLMQILKAKTTKANQKTIHPAVNFSSTLSSKSVKPKRTNVAEENMNSLNVSTLLCILMSYGTTI